MCAPCFAAAAVAAGSRPPFPAADEARALPWPDGAGAQGTMRWTGTAGFRFDHDGTSIAFDPFVSRPGAWRVLLGRPRPSLEAVAERFADLDAVFVGHTHCDHAMDVPLVARVSPRAKIHGSLTTVELARRLGVDEGRLVPVRDGDVFRLGGFEIEAVAAAHGRVPLVGRFDRVALRGEGVPRTPFRYPRGAVFAWRMTAGGRTWHVQGSAGIDAPALARQRPVDALIACLSTRHGTPRYLERLGAALRPRVLVPCHHDDFFRPLTKPPRPIPLLDWDGFLAEAAALERAWGTALYRSPLDATVEW